MVASIRNEKHGVSGFCCDSFRREMTLAPGTRLGPYEILSRIGVGGIGEVWKTRDTCLGRVVAIKKV